MPDTDAEILAIVAKLRAEADQHQALADELRGRADQLEAVVMERGLRSRSIVRTVSTMDVDTAGKKSSIKRAVARATRNHPAQRRLYEQGVTITALAARLGEGRERVSAWFAPPPANRPVPRPAAEKMLKWYGIPLSDWTRVAD